MLSHILSKFNRWSYVSLFVDSSTHMINPFFSQIMSIPKLKCFPINCRTSRDGQCSHYLSILALIWLTLFFSQIISIPKLKCFPINCRTSRDGRCYHYLSMQYPSDYSIPIVSQIMSIWRGVMFSQKMSNTWSLLMNNTKFSFSVETTRWWIVSLFVDSSIYCGY